jgi:hypothetical protein
MTWRSWFDGSGGPIAAKWHVQGWPTLYALDHKGVIRHKWVGSPGDAVMDRAINELVAQAEADQKQQAR